MNGISTLGLASPDAGWGLFLNVNFRSTTNQTIDRDLLRRRTNQSASNSAAEVRPSFVRLFDQLQTSLRRIC